MRLDAPKSMRKPLFKELKINADYYLRMYRNFLQRKTSENRIIWVSIEIFYEHFIAIDNNIITVRLKLFHQCVVLQRIRPVLVYFEIKPCVVAFHLIAKIVQTCQICHAKNKEPKLLDTTLILISTAIGEFIGVVITQNCI